MEGPRLMGASGKARPGRKNASRDALEHDPEKWKSFSEEIAPQLVTLDRRRFTALSLRCKYP
jgi:hypothetical protein